MKHPEDVKVGDPVMFVLNEGPSKGQARPAVVVRVWTPPTVNLVVFVDGSNDGYTTETVWVTSAEYSASSEWRHWRYPD